MNNNSPLEQLTAFAICFVFGIVSTVALSLYGKVVKSKATNSSGNK